MCYYKEQIAEIIWSYYHLDQQRRYRSWPVNLGDQLERAVHKVRRLRWETGKAVTGQVKEKVPDTSFFF